MDEKEDIKQRTFGIEIEMCDFDRSKVTLPDGFEWNKDEQIYNTNGIYNSKFGGEINTPPLTFCDESFSKIKDLYDSINNAGGKLKWSIDTHVHLFAGDLTLEQLKQLVIFQYSTYPYFKKYTNLGEWDEIALHGKPLITEEKFNEIKNAESLNKLKNILANQSQKGFVRYAINVASYFVRNTIEFRCYNATQNFELVKSCVIATYKMFYYALNHTEEDFLSINSYHEFIDRIGLPLNTPPLMIPLIYQGNPYSAKEAFKTKPIYYNSKLGSSLLESLNTNNVSEIAVVNSFMFQYELNLWRKIRVKCYNQDGYSHLLYRLSNGDTRIHYSNNLEWLEKHNSDNPIRQIAIALYIFRIMKFIGENNEFKKIMMNAYKNKAEESISKTEGSAKRLVEMFKSIEYVNGNLHDAINENKAVFFSFGKYDKSRRALRAILENSDYENTVVEKNNDYYDLVEKLPNDSHFYMFSNSPYLTNMHKIALFRNASEYREGCGRFLYCNQNQSLKKADMVYAKESISVDVCIPPNDLDITDYTKLDIYEILSSELLFMQKKFIKKVDNVSQCTFAYAIMYDKYCLGAVGFNFFKGTEYDLWQVSDFCTNNDLPRLSKLILICILSQKMQRMISRRLGLKIATVLSYAYTDAPVSMKYRGLYTKNKERSTSHKLAYVGNLGKYSSMEECINLYQKYKQNAGK